MPIATVRVLDYNTAKPLVGCFVDLGGFTAYTDWKGEAVLTVPSEPLPLKVLHRDYSPYSYSLATLLQDSTVEVRLVPLVSIL
jgi:hypothetical protein